MEKYIIGVDLGGTKITTAISDLEGHLLSKTTVATLSNEGEKKVVNRIIETINFVLKDSDISKDKVLSIGIGSPGIINPVEGKIMMAANLPFKNYCLTEPIQAFFQLPVYLENDANAAALGEFTFGTGRGKKNFIYVTVSTGVGGAAIIDGKLYHGNTSNAFEVGHMILDPKSEIKCNCGLYGDVEALCSGTAIAKKATLAVIQGKETLLSDVQEISTKEVHEAYLKNDAVAMGILHEAFDDMGIAVANFITIFDPEMVVIGGGVASIGNLFFDRVKASAKKSCLDFIFDPVEILPSSLGQDTGVFGALAIAKNNINC
ncbi:MAG: ROK family protein [Clostridiaceae bacterium]